MYNNVTFSKNINIIQTSMMERLVKWIMIPSYNGVANYPVIRKNGMTVCINTERCPMYIVGWKSKCKSHTHTLYDVFLVVCLHTSLHKHSKKAGRIATRCDQWFSLREGGGYFHHLFSSFWIIFSIMPMRYWI